MIGNNCRVPSTIHSSKSGDFCSGWKALTIQAPFVCGYCLQCYESFNALNRKKLASTINFSILPEKNLGYSCGIVIFQQYRQLEDHDINSMARQGLAKASPMVVLTNFQVKAARMEHCCIHMPALYPVYKDLPVRWE